MRAARTLLNLPASFFTTLWDVVQGRRVIHSAATDRSAALALLNMAAATDAQLMRCKLELLIAQLQNQDPLSPMEADQLAVQLAQFSSVEQLIEINEQIGSLGASDGALGSCEGVMHPREMEQLPLRAS